MATPETELLNEPPGGGRNITPVQLAAIVGGLLVLLVVLWFVFLRGGGDEPAESVAPPVTAPETEPSPEPTATAGTGEGPVETFEVFAPKDPFEPLVGAGGGAAGGDGTTDGGDTGTDGGTGTTNGTDGLAGGNGTGTGTDPSGGDTGSGSVSGHRVTVVEVREGSNEARVQVDGTVYTASEGEQFASNFELVSTSGDCATMLYGDDEFTLCEGEAILK